MKYPTPSRATDALIGGDEEDGKQKKTNTVTLNSSIASYNAQGLYHEHGSNFGGQRARDRVILVVRKCVSNAFAVSLALPASDDTSSPGYPRQSVFNLVTASRSLTGNREIDLKPTTFSLFLLLSVFLSFLSSYPSTQWYYIAMGSEEEGRQKNTEK